MTVSLNYHAIQAALHAAGKTDPRHYLNGVLIEPAGSESVNVVGTDGLILVATSYQAEESDLASPVILDRATLEVALKAWPAKQRDEFARLDVTSESTAAIELPNGSTMAVRRVDGRYPDWRAVVPQNRTLDGAGKSPQLRPALVTRAHAALAAACKLHTPKQRELLKDVVVLRGPSELAACVLVLVPDQQDAYVTALAVVMPFKVACSIPPSVPHIPDVRKPAE